MFKTIIQRLCLVALAVFAFNTAARDFLKPEDAFLMTARLSEQQIQIRYAPKPGYYIYQESMQVQAHLNDRLVTLTPQKFPPAHEKFDENFQKIVRTYKEVTTLEFSLKDLSVTSPIQLEVQVQGCAEKGICYPPMTRYFHLTQYDQWVDSQESLETTPTPSIEKNISSWWESRDDLNALNRMLSSTSTPILLLFFFLLGLGLAFTPCMLPMLPILSSVVFGTTKHHELSRKTTLVLAIAYVLGMACAFSIAGMATAWFGAGIAVYLQTPLVTIAFGLLMIGLAGSLLGWYELQLPTVWHGVVHDWMSKHEGGNVFGVLILGALSSLIASPCVTAPLAGVLTFIAQSGQVYLGGLILFFMACGMGLPLLLFALGARSVVPKAGSWMNRVQKLLALLLIAYACWMIYPAASRILAPKQAATSKKIAGLDYQVITTMSQLRAALKTASNQAQPVFITYYADWCVSCKEIDAKTLSNPEVLNQLKNYQRFEVDVTLLGEEQKSLLKEYQLFGPPAMIFFGADGQEKAQQRTVGLIDAQQLIEKLSH